MISKLEFGRTGSTNSHIIFGSWALNKATQEKADKIMQMLERYGVNSIDTSPMYGNAEKVIGKWLAKNRNEYFVATKSRSRSYQGAIKHLKQSLENLQAYRSLANAWLDKSNRMGKGNGSRWSPRSLY
jgi:aryl-alcohol dehydrogenase-like predicted oxidoreductase